MNIELDWNIIASVLSALVGIISVIIAVLTLQQNNKMIEESTRPYVAIYLGYANFQNSNLYLVIKNFGSTGATIDSFKPSFDIGTISHIESKPLFEGIENSFIAPNQSYRAVIDLHKLKEKTTEEFFIKYSTPFKSYEETFKINFGSYSNIVVTRASTKENELKIISYSLQDIAEKML